MYTKEKFQPQYVTFPLVGIKKSNISVSWPTIIGVKNIECQLDDEKWDIFYKVHPNKTQPVQLNDTSKWFRS